MDDSARLAIIRRAVAENAALWSSASGCRVRHRAYGMGVIAGVKLRDGQPKNFLVRFDRATDGIIERRFMLESLFRAEQFPERHPFPEALELIFASTQAAVEADKRRQAQGAAIVEQLRQRKAAAQQEAARRKKEADEHVARVAAKARAGGHLDGGEIEILRAHNEHSLLARYFERQYERMRNAWMAIDASKEWRRANNPDAALRVTGPLLSRLDALSTAQASALLTTRGGAHRDMRNFDAAERCAREAIERNSADPYPYNLLAAIHFQRGEAEEADACLEKVEQLGRLVAERRGEIERAIRSLDDAERARMIETLQQLNPVRYSWISARLGQGRKPSGERHTNRVLVE